MDWFRDDSSHHDARIPNPHRTRMSGKFGPSRVTRSLIQRMQKGNPKKTHLCSKSPWVSMRLIIMWALSLDCRQYWKTSLPNIKRLQMLRRINILVPVLNRMISAFKNDFNGKKKVILIFASSLKWHPLAAYAGGPCLSINLLMPQNLWVADWRQPRDLSLWLHLRSWIAGGFHGWGITWKSKSQ